MSWRATSLASSYLHTTDSFTSSFTMRFYLVCELALYSYLVHAECPLPVRDIVPALVLDLGRPLLNDLVQHLDQTFHFLNGIVVQQ